MTELPRGRSYGDKLRVARERAGIDMVTLAKCLHVRPDILKAIENADFERMPARGYTRNMIRAYARQVGLDEREISEMYLDEVHLHETGTPRMSGSSRGGYTRRQQASSSRFSDSMQDRSSYSASSRYARGVDPYSRDINRTRPDEHPRYARRQSVSFHDDPAMVDRGVMSPRYPDRRQSDSRSIRFSSSPSRRFEDPRMYSEPYRDRRSANIEPRDRGSARSSGSIRFSGAPKDSSSRRRPVTLTQSSHSYEDLYSPRSSKARGPELNMPLIIIIAVVAIAIIIAAVVLFNSTTQSVEQIPDIPIAGYSDTSNPEDEIEPLATLPEPTSVKFTYEVASGGKSWIEIYENGASEPIFSGKVTGPATETYEVSGTLTFSTANPTPVTVTVDGEEVKLTKNPKNEYYSYTVDFSAILAKWRSENDPNYSSSQSTSGNTNSPSNTNTSSNTSSNKSSTSGNNRSFSSSNGNSNTNTSTR